MACRASPDRRSCELAAEYPPEEHTHGFWQDFTTTSVARKRRIDPRHGVRRPFRTGCGYHDRLYLRRIARRLRLQPGPRPGCCSVEENAWPQGGRGGKGAGNRRRRKDDGVDDQSRRRFAAVSDLVRILQSARAQNREQV